MVGGGDGMNGQLHDLGAVGGGEGPLGRRGQIRPLAPGGNHQAAQVQVQQPVGDNGDLVVGGLAAGPREPLGTFAQGADHAMLVQGVGERVDAFFLVVAEQEQGGGEGLGGDGGGGHQSPSFRVWVPGSPWGCSRKLKLGAESGSWLRLVRSSALGWGSARKWWCTQRR